MSVFAPLLNIGIILAIFILEGNIPDLNKILQMCVRGLDITDMSLATIWSISMLVFKICRFLSCIRFCSVNYL